MPAKRCSGFNVLDLIQILKKRSLQNYAEIYAKICSDLTATNRITEEKKQINLT